VLGGLCTMLVSAVAAIQSDRFGRRAFVIAGFAIAVPWSLVVLPLIDTGNPAAFTLAIVVTYAIIGLPMGPMASFLPEIFATRYRYTGSGVAYNLGGILGGAVPPLIAAALLSTFGSWAISAMMVALALLSLGCALALPETRGAALSDEPAGRPRPVEDALLV
jgi:MFS family permease